MGWSIHPRRKGILEIVSKFGLTLQPSGALSKALRLPPAPTLLVSGVRWSSGAFEASHLIPTCCRVQEPLGLVRAREWPRREVGELNDKLGHGQKPRREPERGGRCCREYPGFRLRQLGGDAKIPNTGSVVCAK